MNRRQTLHAAVAVAALATTGCAAASAPSADSTARYVTASSTSASAAAPAGANEVLVLTPYPDIDAKGFEATLQRFTQATGITVRVRGAGGDFVDQLFDPSVRRQVDVALFPQVGVLQDLVHKGYVERLPANVVEGIHQNAFTGLVATGDVDGVPYGVPMRAWVEASVVYRRDLIPSFPKTWEEFDALIEKLKSQGHTPWCLGVGAKGATGWSSTTMVEAYVAAHGGSDPVGLTNQWVSHEITAQDPRIKAGVVWLQQNMRPGYNVWPGAAALDVPVEDSQAPLFTSPAGCAMAPGYGFLTAEYPAGWEKLVAYANYPTAVGSTPVIKGGTDLAAAFNNRVQTQKLLTFMSNTDDYGVEWAALGGYTSPYRGVPQSIYPSDELRGYAQQLNSARLVIPDASDAMPGAVGSGSYWRGLNDLAKGKSVDQVLATMESGWINATPSASPSP